MAVLESSLYMALLPFYLKMFIQFNFLVRLSLRNQKLNIGIALPLYI